MPDTMGITEILERIRDKSSGENIKLGEVVDLLEARGFGPLLMAPALIVILPTGAIPGVPSICGILAFLISIQIALGKKSPWLPQRLAQVSFSRETIKKALNKFSPITKKIDHLFKPRIKILSSPVANRIIAACCAIVGLSMIPLEIVPFLAAIPGLAIFFVALGLSTQDGVLTLLAFIAIGVTFYLMITNFL